LQRNVGFLTLQANYTWAKALGSNGWNVANGTMTAVLPDYGSHYLWGVLPIDRAQVLSLAYVLEMPKINGNKFVKGLANGWQISGITQIESGAQLTNQSGSNGLSFNYGRDDLKDASGNTIQRYDNIHMLGTPDISLYPLITCNPAQGLHKDQFLNPNCFAPAPDGSLGTGSMPYMPGPKFWNTDLSLQKVFKLTERQNLQFRFSAFNFPNASLLSFTGSPSNPDNHLKLAFAADGTLKNTTPSAGHTCPGPTCDAFGYATSHTGHRTLELGVKYQF